MNKEEYRNIFDNEYSHWWYRILDDLVEYFVSTYYSQKPLKILDAGCGTGRMMSKLLKYGEVYGIDASPIAIEMCQSRDLSNVKIADLNEWSAENEFNIIVSLDVLYHQSFNNIDKILNSFSKALHPDGILIMNLPAFNILRREHDEIVGGNKRFRVKEIKDILIKNGFQIHTSSYRHPLLFKYILLKKLFSISKEKSKSDLAPLYVPLNKLLFLINKFENIIIKMGFSIPYGSSLFVVAKKNEKGQNSHYHSQAYAQNNFLFKPKTYVKSKTILKQFFKYSIVGIFNTAIGLTVIYFFFNVLNFNYIIANIIGYACGLVNSFVWNKKWTFKSSQHYSKEIVPFLIVFGISYAANLLAVIISVEFIEIHPNIAQIIGIAAYSSTNFFINRYWTFSRAN
ncbi:MAG TPA: GtrA family protein [Ignavibacteriaceae bacterium]